MKKWIKGRKWNKLLDIDTEVFCKKKNEDRAKIFIIEDYKKYGSKNYGHIIIKIKEKWRNYKLRHLRLGKVKMLDKTNNLNFKIVDIDWDVHWQTDLYLTVIIRDYLRFFIKNTPAIGNNVIENKYPSCVDIDSDWKKWQRLVNSVADEFDELLKIYMKIDTADDASELYKKVKELTKKAFLDLAYIYDDLNW